MAANVFSDGGMAELKRQVFALKREYTNLRRRLATISVRRHQGGFSPPPKLHRGVTDGAIAKGASGTVSRYTPGTTTDSGTNDTMYNELIDVGSGKVVHYMRNGDKLYMIAVECPPE